MTLMTLRTLLYGMFYIRYNMVKENSNGTVEINIWL